MELKLSCCIKPFLSDGLNILVFCGAGTKSVKNVLQFKVRLNRKLYIFSKECKIKAFLLLQTNSPSLYHQFFGISLSVYSISKSISYAECRS